jgi:hypothetical protein
MWEQRDPVPPPVIEGELGDPRRLAYASELDRIPADLRAMHLYEVDATVEDSEVLGMAFHGQQFTLPVYGYHEWWRQSDNQETFAYHRRVLGMLQSQRPPTLWLLKAPHHTFHLDALVSNYPEARFVMTHRDPAKAVASYASFVAAIFPASETERDLVRLGSEVRRHLRIGMERALAARTRVGEDRFLDIHHGELVANPIETIRNIYEFINLEFSPDVEKDMLRWNSLNRPGAHGTHHYDPATFGLRSDEVRDEFRFYTSQFGVAIEESQ